MIHGLITLVACALALLVKLLIPNFPSHLVIFMICFFAFFYIGREHSQAEYRYIEQYCNRKRANMPWYAAFTKKAWTVKALFDFLIPLLVSTASYLIFIIFF